MLWVDKHRPRTMDQLDYHVELSQSLKAMVDRGDFPHILFYGPSGAGKKTRVLALLRDIYGPAVEKVKVEHKQFKVGSTTIEIPILSSAHHIELNPGDAGNRDRDVVQELIKEIAASAPLPTSTSGDKADWKPFKVVVLNEVDNLSKEAQHALRRTMEKCAAPRVRASGRELVCDALRRSPPCGSPHLPPAARAQVHLDVPDHDDLQQRLPRHRADPLALPERARARAERGSDRGRAAGDRTQGGRHSAAAARREARGAGARQPAQGAAHARGRAGTRGLARARASGGRAA